MKFIKFQNTHVYNLANAVVAARNPMNSWSKSDTDIIREELGNNDLELARKLIKAGSEHRKFMRQIFVSVDITAPRYWWQEFDTYAVGVAKNSCSTMHTLVKNQITADMFECDLNSAAYINEIVLMLEYLRCKYNETKDFEYFRSMKQILPESFKQRRTVTLNYENVLTMLKQRKNHKLSEWHSHFVNWAMTLPYAKEFFLE